MRSVTSPTAMPRLHGERVIVRPFTAGDLEAVTGVLNRAWNESLSVEERAPWFEWTRAGYGALAGLSQPPYGDRAIVRRATGELVGVAGLVPALGPFGTLPSLGGDPGNRLFRPEVGLYWAVDPAHQGHGYATEAARALVDFAFAQLSLAVIVATTTYDNATSIAVMRRLGMTIDRNPHPEPAWFQVCGVLSHPGSGRR